MPELPEVETTVRDLRKKIVGKKITDVWTDYSSSYKHYKKQIKNRQYFSRFKKEVGGKKIAGVERRGKNILIHLSSGNTILIHMKMTGHLLYGRYVHTGGIKNRELGIKSKKESLPDKWENEEWLPIARKNSPLWDSYNRHIHLVFTLSGGTHLILSDARKFARVKLLTGGELEESSELGNLGPNPLEISRKKFLERLHTRKSGKIKQVLMDQRVLAGIGNIYSDEALWKAGIHPASSLKKIPYKKLEELCSAVKEVLKKGIKFGGDSTSDYRTPDGEKGEFQHRHSVYGKKGLKCPRDGEIIKTAKIGGRTASFCPKHQKKY